MRGGMLKKGVNRRASRLDCGVSRWSHDSHISIAAKFLRGLGAIILTTFGVTC